MIKIENLSLDPETIYDRYSPVLYNIALEISPTKDKANNILKSTFQEFFKLKVSLQNYTSLCMVLIKLLIKSAHVHLDHTSLGSNLKLKQFEATPLLHQLLCEQINLDDYCSKKIITREEATKQIREEFNSFRIIDASVIEVGI